MLFFIDEDTKQVLKTGVQPMKDVPADIALHSHYVWYQAKQCTGELGLE